MSNNKTTTDESGSETANQAEHATAPTEGNASETDGATDPTLNAEEDGGPGLSLIDDDDTAQVLKLEDTVANLQARLRTVSAAYQKQLEEVTATRERLTRQAALKEEMRRGEVVASLFEPLENLRRSLTSLKQGSTVEDTAAGLEMVVQQFMSAFQALGLEEVPGEGAKFDPNLHEALSVIPVPDPALDDVIVSVFSAGYRIGTRLISPARVVVGQCSGDGADDGATES